MSDHESGGSRDESERSARVDRSRRSVNDRRRSPPYSDDRPRVNKVREDEGHDRDSSRRSPHERSEDDKDVSKSRRREHRTEGGERSKHRRRRSRSPKESSSKHHRHLRHSDSSEAEPRRHQQRSSREHRYERHERDSRHRRHHRDRSSPSSPLHHRARQRSASLPRAAQPYKRAPGPLPPQESAYRGKPASNEGDAVIIEAPIEKQKPDYSRSGKLAAETNTVAGTSIVLKYNEPPESRKPPASADWRMYVFKGQETLETVQLDERTCWLFGRERTVVDFPIEHPSCSKQHAVLQFRHVEKKNEFGERKGEVKPYVIDLESANGTKVNGEKIPGRRFWEIVSGDVLGFGDSTREYVIMLAPKG